MFLRICPIAFSQIVIVIAIILIYKELFKEMKMSKFLLKIGFIKLLIFRLFSTVIQCNTEVKN